jgi:hypothetical protein
MVCDVVSPAYNADVPMRSGDILLFNPAVPRCLTDPRKAGVHVFSVFVSAKSMLTEVSNYKK